MVLLQGKHFPGVGGGGMSKPHITCDPHMNGGAVKN